LNPVSDRSGLGSLAVIGGMIVFVGVASLFAFVLVFMNAASGGSASHGLGNPDDIGPPIAAGLAAGIAVIMAVVLPPFVLRPLRRRIDGRRRLEAYGAALFLVTVAFALCVLFLAFIAAFMTQELVHFAVAVPLALLPVVLVWPTDGHRAKWMAGRRDGA